MRSAGQVAQQGHAGHSYLPLFIEKIRRDFQIALCQPRNGFRGYVFCLVRSATFSM